MMRDVQRVVMSEAQMRRTGEAMVMWTYVSTHRMSARCIPQLYYLVTTLGRQVLLEILGVPNHVQLDSKVCSREVERLEFIGGPRLKRMMCLT